MPPNDSSGRNAMACPVCKTRMELLSRHADYVTAGCKDCRLSLTLSTSEWDAAKAKRDAGWRVD